MVPQQQRRRRRRAALARTTERRVVVARGVGGFGFTIAGQRPCVVSAVAAGGPAERAGLRAGDALLAVDGAGIARAPHASVARLIAAAPGAIALSVAPRESPPTDTEDTEPDERARTRRRHPPPRRRPQPAMVHHPGCQSAPSTSGVNEILQNLSRAQLTPHSAARLECRAVVGYLGTIETPQASAPAAPGNVRSAVRKLRQERRPATPVLLTVLPNILLLRRPTGNILAQYPRERIVYAGCGSEADRRYFGLVTSAESADNESEASHSCHVFAVDPRMAEHEAHATRVREFQIVCTRDPVAERCLEFPPSSEYVVGVIRGMYSLPADDCASPMLQQISKLAVKGDSPAAGNFSRSSRPMFRPRDRRACRHEDGRLGAPDAFLANSPQPSNHSEITTASSNSDSGIGFHNDGRNVADRILVVDFGGRQPPPPSRYRQDVPRRPMGLVGCNFEDGAFLSNTTPVVDGFAGQGRPLNLDDVILSSNEPPPVRHAGPRCDDDAYNYNNIYGNVAGAGGAWCYSGPVYETESDVDRVAETFNSVDIYEERSRQIPDYRWNESAESVTVVSDSVSVYSSRSHEDARPPPPRRHLQASLDDMLVLGLRDPPHSRDRDDDNFVHPGTVKYKIRKSSKTSSILSKTKHMFVGRDKDRRRALSASAGDVAGGAGDGGGGDAGGGGGDELAAAASEPDLRDTQSEQSSPFRRWTTGNGATSSYRHHDPRTMYNKQMSEGTDPAVSGAGAGGAGAGGAGGGGVARWSLGLEQLLADPAGAAAFAHFLDKEFAAENIRFWWSCEQYSRCGDAAERAALAQQIWQRHLAERAHEPVNVDAAARRATQLRLHCDPPPQDLFHQAQKQIFNVMKFDSYPRFLRSAVHAECARADLCGLPPPYAADHRSPQQQQQQRQQQQQQQQQLKKSSSNASERRRSGGGSLLPWRLRPASRERAQPAADDAQHGTEQQQQQQQQQQQVVFNRNVVRILLPDSNGVSSAAMVDDAVTVRQLVDRQLAKRGLRYTSYDVYLVDEDAQCQLIEPGISSSAVGGRRVQVERRCVVRLEVGARCVAVRARPARRLRHVLRPVLLRYLAAGAAAGQRAPAAAALTPDGNAVPLDTEIQELDGARLRIVEVDSGAECGAAGVAGGDVDSPYELAARPDDQPDAMSCISGSSASRSECGSGYGVSGMSGAGRPSAAGGPSGAGGMNGAGGPSGTSGPGGMNGASGVNGGAGRVRVAVRPGPPLHHHPPGHADLLDDLREKQKLRQQSKSEALPLPRSPPPLPPKPAPRAAPTLV